MTDSKVPLSKKLNLETAQAPWRELQPFFARGDVIQVKAGQDLLLVAEQLAADNAPLFQQWLSEGSVNKVSDDQALIWYQQDTLLWTVVIKPWVLVQESSEIDQAGSS